MNNLKFQYTIKEIVQGESMNTIIQKIPEGNKAAFESDFRLIKTTSGGGAKYKYKWTGRISVIIVYLCTSDKKIHISIQEAPMGYLIPVTFLIGALIEYFFVENVKMALFCLGVSLLSFLYIYFVFRDYAKNIKEKLEAYLDPCIHSNSL